MTTTRFNQDESRPHGRCLTCGITIATAEDGNTHMSETMGDAGSHQILSNNPTRERRISVAVDEIVNASIDKAMEAVDMLISREEITEEEAATALKSWPDFEEAWGDWT